MEALKMDPQTNSWNDDRLDELSRRTDEGFKEMREGFARVDREMKEIKDGFAQVPTREEMSQRFSQLDARFDRLHHTLIVAGATVVAAVLVNGIFG
jgi:hypothetical protein